MSAARTERPTRRRLREARRAGRVVHNPVLTGAAALGAAAVGLTWGGEWLVGRLVETMQRGLGPIVSTPDDSLAEAAWLASSRVGEPLLTLPIGIAAAALLVAFVQVGPLLATGPVKPDWGRVGPSAGWQRLWSPDARLARWRALLAGLVIVGVSVAIGVAALPDLARLPRVSVGRGVAAVELVWARWLWWTLLGLVVLGLVDWAWKRRQLTESLRMTRRELREERRETEGEPLVRAERERRQAIAASVARDVADAALVVTGATEAVALFWDPAIVDVPEMLARGSGDGAARLRLRARRHGIAVVEAPALARSLVRLGVGEPVPEALFDDVARVLSR